MELEVDCILAVILADHLLELQADEHIVCASWGCPFVCPHDFCKCQGMPQLFTQDADAV